MVSLAVIFTQKIRKVYHETGSIHPSKSCSLFFNPSSHSLYSLSLNSFSSLSLSLFPFFFLFLRLQIVSSGVTEETWIINVHHYHHVNHDPSFLPSLTSNLTQIHFLHFLTLIFHSLTSSLHSGVCTFKNYNPFRLHFLSLSLCFLLSIISSPLITHTNPVLDIKFKNRMEGEKLEVRERESEKEKEEVGTLIEYDPPSVTLFHQEQKLFSLPLTFTSLSRSRSHFRLPFSIFILQVNTIDTLMWAWNLARN